MGLQLGSVCFHFTLGDAQQLPKAPAQRYPQQRFHLAWQKGHYLEAWSPRKGVLSQAHPLCCSRQAQGSSLCATAVRPFPKAQRWWRGTQPISLLQILLLQPAKGRFDLCHGSHGGERLQGRDKDTARATTSKNPSSRLELDFWVKPR